MSFVRRFVSQPTAAQETAIEGVNIIANQAASAVREAAEGVCTIFGEALKGAYETPLEFEPNSPDDFINIFGGYNPYLGVAPGFTGPGGVNGNLYLAFLGKTFQRNIGIRVDMRCTTTSGGDTPFQLLITVTGASASTTYTLPAGMRFTVAAGPYTVMLDNDYTFTTDSSGDATVSPFVSGVTVNFMPGQVAAHISASATWVITDSALLPGDLTTSNTVATNAGSAPNATCYPAPAHVAQYSEALNSAATTVSPGYDADLICSAYADPDASATVAGVTYTGGIVASLIQAHLVSFRAYGKGRFGVAFGVQGDSVSTANNVLNLSLTNCKASSFMAYAFPWVQQFVPAAQATLTVPPAPWVASAMASVNPEQNPGEQGIQALQAILGLETTVQPVEADYVALKAAGIAAFLQDQITGIEIQSGITTDTVTPTDVKTQRFYDFAADTLGSFAKPYAKKLTTIKRKAAFVKAISTWLDGLVSTEDPDLQRINDYGLDTKSANTAARLAAGIYAVKVSIQLIPGMDFIDFILGVGTTVTIEDDVTSSANPT